MKRKIGFLIVLVAMLSMMLVPAGAFAADVGLDAVVYDKVVNLDNKINTTPTGTWDLTPLDNTGATLLYNVSGDMFEWSLDAMGLDPLTSYSLIYYADQSSRFDEWGGNNPGALIANIMTDGDGNYVSANTVDLGMPLPCFPDANIDEYDYSKTVAAGGTGDMYANAHGAKIWLVLTADYTAPELMDWNPASYLFETDLINYTDTNAIVSITVSPTDVDFGSVVAGAIAGPETVTVSNAGTVPVIVTALAPTSGLFSNLLLNAAIPSLYSMPLPKTVDDDVSLTLPVPTGHAPGQVVGTLIFVATPAN